MDSWEEATDIGNSKTVSCKVRMSPSALAPVDFLSASFMVFLLKGTWSLPALKSTEDSILLCMHGHIETTDVFYSWFILWVRTRTISMWDGDLIPLRIPFIRTSGGEDMLNILPLSHSNNICDFHGRVTACVYKHAFGRQHRKHRSKICTKWLLSYSDTGVFKSCRW